MALRAKQALKAQLFPDRTVTVPQIGRFIVLRELGRGGMGVVYAAYDETLDRRVALKLLYDLPGGDADGQARLLREAQAMARLNHPNIAAVYEVGTHDERVFVAMEFVQGEPLDMWLRSQPRTWREVVDVFIQAGRGLHAAHSAGLIHRDFKPANVMLGRDGRARVLDFGLVRGTQQLTHDVTLETLATRSVSMPVFGAARTSPPAIDHALTREGTIVGTPAYMPPEQFRGEPIDARADQYALCVSLFEGLYGQHPFRGSTLAELWAAALAGPPRARPRGSRVPAWLHRIVLRGLNPDRSGRFPSMAALLDALEQRPGRRLRMWMAGTLVASTVVGSVYGLDRQRNAQCAFDENDLVGIWDPERRAALKAALERDNSPQGREAWSTAVAILDTKALNWLEVQQEACEAHRNGAESSLTYDRRRQCLHRFKQALASTINALSGLEKADAEQVKKTITLLDSQSECTSANAVEWGIDPPPSNKQEEVDILYRAFYDLARRAADSDDPSHLSEIRDLTAKAEAVGYRSLLVDIMRLRSGIEANSELHHESCNSTKETFFLAEATGRDVQAAFAAMHVIHRCRDFGASERANATAWARVAIAKIDRAGELGSEAHLSILGGIALKMLHMNYLDEASEYIISGFTVISEDPERPSGGKMLSSRIFFEIGARYLHAADQGAQSHAVRKALAGAAERFYGSRAVFAQGVKLEVSEYMERGQLREALAVTSGAIMVLKEAEAPDNASLAMLLSHQSAILGALERCSAARGAVDEMLQVSDISEDTRIEVLAGAVAFFSACGEISMAESFLQQLDTIANGRGFIALLQRDAALAIYETFAHGDARAVGAVERIMRLSKGAEHLLPRSGYYGLLQISAEANWRSGKLQKAKSDAERAIALVEDPWGSSNLALAAPLTILGQTELEEGNVKLAIQYLERALALRTESDPQFRAESGFPLARALAKQPGSAARARTVGEQALADYAAAGEHRAAEHAKVAAWLATL